MSSGSRANALRRGLAVGGHGNASGSGAAAGNSSGIGGGSSVGSSYMDSLTDDQVRTLRRRLETIRALEQETIELEALKEDRVRPVLQDLGVDGSASARALAEFKLASDWERVGPEAAEQFGPAPRLTWDMLKKAVAEEDKYQSKKNWSSTKGRGNRKAPVARRLDAEALKRLGVYPTQQFLALAQCDSCGRQVNAHFLKDHQERHCMVSSSKRDDKRAAVAKAKERVERDARKDAKHTGAVAAGVKRPAADLDDPEGEPEAKAVKMTKKERLRLEKEQREKERRERKEQQQMAKERKNREREEKRERELAKASQPLDLDRQCGVVSESGAAPCTRSLTCKSHSMAMKRAVRGRSNMFDALLQAHLAKSRSAAAARNAASRDAAAKSSNAAAVRNATAMALGGGGDGALDEAFFEESDHDCGSDSEAEMVIDSIRCSRGQPMAVRPALQPRRRHHYLRVRDLFYDALRPSMGSEAAAAIDALATI